jgi:hypothetical protein
MSIEEWCYAECERQHATTEADITNMLTAYGFATGIAAEDRPIQMWEIIGLGALVDPIANPGGRFRSGPAVFMNGGAALSADRIPEALENLFRFHMRFFLTPEDTDRELMYIHPFKDGNGRVGALVYNILNGTIDDPVVPPEYR